MHDALAVMARAPRLNHCKTRLIPALGAQGALDAHVLLVRDTLARLRDIKEVAVSLWTTEDSAEVQSWAAQYGLPLRMQQGADLGARMHHVLESLLADGARRACVIGTDCPAIDTRYVTAAFVALHNHDVVVGPAEDGGYGLIGLRAACPDLFNGIDWNTSDVLAQTRERAGLAGLDVAELGLIWDVDTPSDWRRYQTWRERAG